ncbi:MAG TPA: glycerophosphodiester phosphodiesterase [Burkholderiales bacterium]|nr:glycerophosphodiester phosphodiesterase [Burkholderiales bacterium]
MLLIALISQSTTAFDLQGHRGARGHAPENTLPGFERALELGVDTLELDVGVTRDGVVVIHHDRRLNPDLARGPDGQWIAAPGPTLHSLTYAELQRYDVGRIRPGSEYAKQFAHQKPLDGTRIPRLADLFELVKDSTVRFNIETKVSAKAPDETLPPEPFARALLAEVRKAGVERRTTIQSFDFRTLAVVQSEAPGMATAYLTSERKGEAIPRMVREAKGAIWSPDWRDLDPRALAVARELGLRVIPWTVNQPADIARVLDLKVDGIISDYPDRVRAALKARR